MRKKIITYFTILSVCILVFSIVINKIIIDKKFPLKTNDLKGLEELTSKVFIFTTHTNNQKMDHHKLIYGLGFLPYTSLDNELTENFFFIYNTAMNYLKLDGYSCGGHARYLQRIFEKHGIKSFTYNHGIDGTAYTHVLVIAEYRDNLYIFDPTFNYVYYYDDKYLTLEEVINLIKQKKSLKKFIKIINPQDKVFNLEKRTYENYTSDQVVEWFNKSKYLMTENKNHSLLNGFGAYAGYGSMDYFFEKYPYLKSLIEL
tara:strand:- start:403 stop:1176 length:774 start_codon:yes stop_codon:yes gene_type:complete